VLRGVDSSEVLDRWATQLTRLCRNTASWGRCIVALDSLGSLLGGSGVSHGSSVALRSIAHVARVHGLVCCMTWWACKNTQSCSVSAAAIQFDVADNSHTCTFQLCVQVDMHALPWHAVGAASGYAAAF
jgi:hypothetical protein